MATAGRRWHVVRCYLVLHDASTLECIVAAIGQIPSGVDILLIGDYILYMVAPEGQECDNTIAVEMAVEDLEEMAGAFHKFV